MDIIITIPSSIEWSDYEKELKSVEDGTNVMNFKLATFPKHCRAGERCYVVHRGKLRGYMVITGFETKHFTCQTTGRPWTGHFVIRSGSFYECDQFTMEGFRGFRYMTSALKDQLLTQQPVDR